MVHALHEMGWYDSGSFVRFKFIDCNTLRMMGLFTSLQGPPTWLVHVQAWSWQDVKRAWKWLLHHFKLPHLEGAG
jgi:hypothetical protein